MSIFKIFHFVIISQGGHNQKNYVHMLKTMTSRSWDEIKIVKKNRNCLKIVKNENFQHLSFRYFYVRLSLNAKNHVRRSKGVACGQYKDKEGKNEKSP